MSLFGMAGRVAGKAMSAASHPTSTKGVSSLQRQTRLLENNLAKALLINEALWEIIRDKLNLTEEDLHNKLYEIDMRDGQLDGKNQRQAAKCNKCHRMISSRHAACLYCGHIIDESVFRMT